MLNHLWTVATENSVLEQGSGNLSLFNVLDRIQIQMPDEAKTALASGTTVLAPIKHHIVSCWENEDGIDQEFSLRLQILSPDGAEIGNVVNEFQAAAQTKRIRTIQRFDALPILTPGVYRLKLSIQIDDSKFKSAANIPLELEFRDEI